LTVTEPEAPPEGIEALAAVPTGLDATQTVIESVGYLWVAPVGTAFPTSYTDPATPWVQVGHTTTDGPRPTGWERGANRLFSWQSPNVPIRVQNDPAEPQFLVDLLQVNGQTLQLFFGGGTVVAGTPPAPDVFTPPGPTVGPVEQALIVDWWDGSRQYRWCVKRTSPIAGGDITLASNELAVFPVRFDVLAPADGSGWGEFRYPHPGP
jgi:hypothetical protein